MDRILDPEGSADMPPKADAVPTAADNDRAMAELMGMLKDVQR